VPRQPKLIARLQASAHNQRALTTNFVANITTIRYCRALQTSSGDSPHCQHTHPAFCVTTIGVEAATACRWGRDHVRRVCNFFADNRALRFLPPLSSHNHPNDPRPPSPSINKPPSPSSAPLSLRHQPPSKVVRAPRRLLTRLLAVQQ
jgi:hypothetical protein